MTALWFNKYQLFVSTFVVKIAIFAKPETAIEHLKMRNSITFILFVLYLPHFGFSQDFGCYDLEGLKENIILGSSPHHGTAEGFIYRTDWKEYVLDSNIADGYFINFHFDANTCTREVKMQGTIKNGLQKGTWKLHLDAKSFYIGSFERGKKEGLWKGYYLNEMGDSICISEIEFKRDLYDGITNYYFPNGKLYKTIAYKDNLVNGREIKYFENDTSGENYISEWKEYTNGVLNGKNLIYNQYKPGDTLTYGIYCFGEKNSRFIDEYSGHKFVVEYVKDKVEGKFIKYFSNGNVAYEFDYRNNLPYNLVQLNDTAGNRIADNSFHEGTGVLNYYNNNGTLVSSFEYKDQLISGKFARYHKSGKVMEEGNIYTNRAKCFKKTKPIDQCEDLNLFSAWQLNFASGTNYKTFNENGSKRANLYASFNASLGEDIIFCESYANGKLVRSEAEWRGLKFGIVKAFYENGQLKETGNYIITDIDSIKTSWKDSVFKYYHSNGALKAEVSYSNGNEIGSAYFFDESGVLKRVKVIESKNASYNIYDNDTINHIDEKGRKQGKWISFENPYSNDDCNDIPNYIRFFHNDRPTGIWEYYSLDGSHLSDRIVWQDSVQAYSQQFNFNGQLWQEGNLINGIENGEWKVYDPKKGYLRYKGNYDCGERNGVWQQFKRNGKPKKSLIMLTDE